MIIGGSIYQGAILIHVFEPQRDQPRDRSLAQVARAEDDRRTQQVELQRLKEEARARARAVSRFGQTRERGSRVMKASRFASDLFCVLLALATYLFLQLSGIIFAATTCTDLFFELLWCPQGDQRLSLPGLLRRILLWDYMFTAQEILQQIKLTPATMVAPLGWLIQGKGTFQEQPQIAIQFKVFPVSAQVAF